jgi:hypothetical protein
MMIIIIIIILPVIWRMTPQKITYRIWSVYKHGALFHGAFKLQGKEILKTVFMWYMNVAYHCYYHLSATHTWRCVMGSLLSTFYHIYAFKIFAFPFYAIKILNYSLFHLWMRGLFLSNVSELSFHTEITWEVDSVLLWMFFTLITNDTVC